MSAWLDAAGRFFNPEPKLSVVPLLQGQSCIVIDDVLANPQGLVAWAQEQTFEPPSGYPYPGLVLDAPVPMAERMTDHFNQHVRRHVGARRTLDLTLRLSLVTVPPAQLEPRQWQCHRDRVAGEGSPILFAASVLYLFHDAALGGTSFYVPRQSSAATDQMLADSQMLDAHTFSTRYGVAQGYMMGTNTYFERIAQVPAAWNRAIYYDGGLFHSADIDRPDLLSADAAKGRLTLNGFFTCTRTAS